MRHASFHGKGLDDGADSLGDRDPDLLVRFVAFLEVPLKLREHARCHGVEETRVGLQVKVEASKDGDESADAGLLSGGDDLRLLEVVLNELVVAGPNEVLQAEWGDQLCPSSGKRSQRLTFEIRPRHWTVSLTRSGSFLSSEPRM